MSEETALRAELIRTCRSLAHLGLSHGTSGNVSVRLTPQCFLISPSGLPYEQLTPADVAQVTLGNVWYGQRRPSSEWRFHRDIYAARSDVQAIVHTHSRCATAIACTGAGIPAFHYMVAVAGGEDIRCAPYRTFGTQELSDAAIQALQERRACLLANHGVIAVGADLARALALAGEVENLAAQYLAALGAGSVQRLSPGEMARVLAKFSTYGQGQGEDPPLRHGGPDARTP